LPIAAKTERINLRHIDGNRNPFESADSDPCKRHGQIPNNYQIKSMVNGQFKKQIQPKRAEEGGEPN
jgi:hypothetical protein